MNKSALIVLAILGSGLVAGVFFAFSTFIMAALARLPTAQGIVAMQSINITVITPVFMVVLFGTAILAGYLAYFSFNDVGIPGNFWILMGSLAYMCSILITLILNVPLKDALAALDPAGHDAARFWNNFIEKWTNYNHLRSCATLAACACFSWSLLLVD